MKRQNDGIDVKGKSPGFYYYPSDFERDVQGLSLAAQGLWVRMLGWMHFSDRRGFLEHATGVPMTIDDIAAKVGRAVKQVAQALAEMERIGLFSRDERDCIFNRRMKKDTEISESRKRAGEARVLDAERDDYGRLRPKGSPAVSPPTSPAEVQHPVQQNTDAPARMSVPAHDSASTSDSASDTDSVSSPYSSAMSSPNDAAALRANGGVGDVVEVGAAPTQPMQPGSVNGMQPSPIHDAAWFDFRITAERAGMTGSEPDWDEAWRFHWRRMDVGEQGAAHAGIVERTGTDDPVLKSLPTNYLKLKKWQRKTRAPDASPEEQRRARRQRELSERMKHL